MPRFLPLPFAAIVVLACSDSTLPFEPPVLQPGALILNGVGETGVTFVPSSGAPNSHIDFGASFDGATFTVLDNIVLSTSSSLKGDQLYVADLSNGSLQRVQLPAASNPAGATFLLSGADGARNFAVALRNSGSIARVEMRAGLPAGVTTVANAGLCPSDVFFAISALWSVDANVMCSTDYAVAGPGRLIRVPQLVSDLGRDTIPLGPAIISPLRAFAIGNFAYVLSSGAFVVPAAVVKLDLMARSVVATRIFPQGAFGATMALGANGMLYVTAATGFNPYLPKVYAIDPLTLTFQGPFAPSGSHRLLTTASGAEQPKCDAATGDAGGRIYCIDNGEVLAVLNVFAANGAFVRSHPAGTLAFDVTVR
ncbi:MAG: hypothetical protein H7Z74_09140 [Anaerolineae bacterium]|nr:hypothetical protein [Gemmatimonadaceae bacterium]